MLEALFPFSMYRVGTCKRLLLCFARRIWEKKSNMWRNENIKAEFCTPTWKRAFLGYSPVLIWLFLHAAVTNTKSFFYFFFFGCRQTQFSPNIINWFLKFCSSSNPPNTNYFGRDCLPLSYSRKLNQHWDFARSNVLIIYTLWLSTRMTNLTTRTI